MKFSERVKSFFSGRPSLSEDLFEDLCDLLVEGDFGAAEAFHTVEELKELSKKEKLPPDVLPLKLASLLENELLKAGEAADPFYGIKEQKSSPPNIPLVLLLGVNGVGKTTTAAKLASLCRTQYGLKPILAAADTYRAAAIDQLKIHGQRLEVRVIAHQSGGDPAAAVYDALEAAVSGGGDIVIADTAGRMHTKSALIEELRKIDRVAASKAGGGKNIKYLVLDATTGRNALAQAEIFHEAVTLDGVVLTKYDSSAKGGVVFSLASQLHLPVIFICTGEKYGDIKYFNSGSYAKEFAGIE